LRNESVFQRAAASARSPVTALSLRGYNVNDNLESPMRIWYAFAIFLTLGCTDTLEIRSDLSGSGLPPFGCGIGV